MKEEVEIEEIVDVEPAGTEELNNATVADFAVLENTIQEQYCSVYNTTFQNTETINSYVRIYLIESLNHVAADVKKCTKRFQKLLSPFKIVIYSVLATNFVYGIGFWPLDKGKMKNTTRKVMKAPNGPYRVFKVEQKPLKFVHANRNVPASSSSPSIVHISMVKNAVNVGGNG